MIIELKRGKHKLQLLQAVSYAAMIASRPTEWFKQQLTPDQLDDLQNGGLSEGLDRPINKTQRIVLSAEEFEPQVIIASRWLREFGIGAKCIELKVTRDEADPELRYMQFAQIFPSPYTDYLVPDLADSMPPEFAGLLADLKAYASSRSSNTGASPRPHSAQGAKANPTDRESFLSSLRRPELVEFAKRWEENGEKILPDSGYRLVFPRTRERWRVQLRGDYAWVMQNGRFEEDKKFWKDRLSHEARIRVLRDGARLHFDLRTKPDLDAFWTAINGTSRRYTSARSNLPTGTSARSVHRAFRYERVK
ncbi:MAG: hypothetical protein WDN25_28630 [Acetobacteraceae bacterium]